MASEQPQHEGYPYVGYYYYGSNVPGAYGPYMSYTRYQGESGSAAGDAPHLSSASLSSGPPYPMRLYHPPALYYPPQQSMMPSYQMPPLQYAMPPPPPPMGAYGPVPSDPASGAPPPPPAGASPNLPVESGQERAYPVSPPPQMYPPYQYGYAPYYSYSPDPAQLVPQSQVMGQPMSLVPGYGATLVGHSPHGGRSASFASGTEPSRWRTGKHGRGGKGGVSPSSGGTRSAPLTVADAPVDTTHRRGSETEKPSPSPSETLVGSSLTGSSSSNETPRVAPQGPMSEAQRQGVRSNYVMWCGNVPSDATLEELWAFFTNIPEPDQKEPPEAEPSDLPCDNKAGIVSIFIIARSSCAFVNYRTQEQLERACEYFQGKPLRQQASCAKLVCRPRKQEDADYAGVAAQRGKGIHVAWYREQKKTERERLAPTAGGTLRQVDPEEGGPEEPPAASHSSCDSRSFSSTNSSLLQQPAFRHRFFILKSRSREALEHAISSSSWTTQPHNEPVLDQAFRNSATVYLIFSGNLSGEMFGCAVMAGAIADGHASRKDADMPAAAPSDPGDHSTEFVAEPTSLAPSDAYNKLRRGVQEEASTRSPAASDDGHHSSFTSTTPSMAAEQESVEQLATSAMIHNLRLDVHASQDEETQDTPEQGTSRAAEPSASRGAQEDDTPTREMQNEAQEAPAPETEKEEPNRVVTGRPFPIHWIITRPLPFTEVQHLRNPWRDNRLIKVSRDGTELEPRTGQELLKVWGNYLESHTDDNGTNHI